MEKTPYILTFDIGTSSCKATVFGADLEILGYQKGSYTLKIVQEGWVEQSVSEILGGVREAVEKLSEMICLSKVKAVSISSQASAQCFVDKEDRPLTNIISWMDKRAEAEAREFVETFSREEIIHLTGMDMVVTPAYSIAKLRWFRKHHPEILERAKYFVQIKEIVIHELTGEWVSDSTSLKGIVDQETGKPIQEIMEFIGAPLRLIPQVKKPYEQAGTVKPRALGLEVLPEGIPVVVGWNDMNAAFLGMTGFPKTCIGLDMTGTSEHFGVVMPIFKGEVNYDGLNRVPFLNGFEAYYGVTSSGGQAAEWFSREILRYDSVADCFSRLEPYEEFPVEEVKDLIFVPYLEGERNPWNDTKIRGSWMGLSRLHRQEHLAWSVLEGVCFALRAMYERFPVKPEQVVLSGGACRSDVWCQMKADVMGIPFVRPKVTEAGCVGAAILAAWALHPQWTQKEFAQFLSNPQKVFMPDTGRASYYDRKYRKFLAFYRALRKLS